MNFYDVYTIFRTRGFISRKTVVRTGMVKNAYIPTVKAVFEHTLPPTTLYRTHSSTYNTVPNTLFHLQHCTEHTLPPTTLYRTHSSTYNSVPNTLFHLQGCLYHWHINKLYHSCTYNRLPEDETSFSKHVEDIVKF